MDWRAGKEEKSKPTTREIEFNSGEGQQRGRGGIWGRVIAGMAGQGIRIVGPAARQTRAEKTGTRGE